jgi:hypothetical protein
LIDLVHARPFTTGFAVFTGFGHAQHFELRVSNTFTASQWLQGF